MRNWKDLPKELQNDEVFPYYKYLKNKQISLFFKRVFDIIMSLFMIIILSPLLIILGILIKIDSKGSPIYKSNRVTQYNRVFKIYKFRTMIEGADKLGSQVTIDNDTRITRIGKTLRKYRLDELPQLFNILKGDMSFVGTRPESVHYVKYYTNEMYATLLMRAGVTSKASIEYKDEAELLNMAENVDNIYINKILPGKMEININTLKNFSLINEFKILFNTIIAVIRKD
nr:sugar transferase [Anaerococcus porci]